MKNHLQVYQVPNKINACFQSVLFGRFLEGLNLKAFIITYKSHLNSKDQLISSL